MKHLKKLIPLCVFALILAISVTLLTPKAQAATSGTCGDSLTWSLDTSGTLTISGTGPMYDWGYGGAPWYSEKTNIKSVVIKSGVTTVGNYAFGFCYFLQSVTLPTSVTSIGSNAFYRCEALQSITIPSGVTTIGHYAFQNCSALENVSLGTNLATIGTSAFHGCAIQTISLPDNIQAVGANAFQSCSNLTFTVYDNATYLGNSENPYLVLIDAVATDITSCKIHKDTKVLGDHSLSHCKNLQSITIPDGVRTIGSLGLYNCKNLQSITLPDSVTTIRSQAFDGCTALQSVTLGKNLNTIGGYAFRACESLTSVTIPASVTTINNAPFASCSNLTGIWVETDNAYYSNDDSGVLFNKNKTEIIQVPGGISGHYTIPDTVKEIGSSVFSNCANLQSVTIPEGVTTIGSSAFAKCTSLESVVMPDSVTTADSSVFADCTALKSVQLSDSLTSIGDSMFARCKNLQSITLPNSATAIGSSAFSGCSALQSVTIGNYVETIAYSAFYNCSALESLTIPASVTGIGSKAFGNCSSLTGIWVNTGNANYCSDNRGVLFNKDKTTLIQAPATLQSYTVPSSVTSIASMAFSGCANLQSISLSDSLASIGENAFYGCAALQSVTIPNSVTTINSQAFYGCTALKSIVIPDSVTSTGYGIFSECTSLQSATLGKGLINLYFDDYSYWFENCYSLTGIWISAENPYYSSDENGVVFNKAKTTLHRVPGGFSGNYTIPDSVTYISSAAFTGCARLESVTINKNISSLSMSTFMGCDSLAGIYVAADNPSFSSDENGVLFNKDKTALMWLPCTFSGHYFIPESVSTVEGAAFYGCANLTDLTVPASVTSFAAYFSDDNGSYIYSFNTCTALQDIYFAGTQSQWDSICNDYGTQYITATIHCSHVHDYNVFPPQTVQPTCTEDGYTVYTCAYDLSDTYTEVLPKLGHITGENTVTVPATCAEEGYIQSTCTRCGQTAATEVLPMLGHDYTGPEKSVLFCTESGYAGASCTRCDAVRNDRTVDAAGHAPVLITVTAPTCTEEGYSTAGTKCSRCDMIFVQPTPSPALGHDFVDGACSRCQETDPDYVPEIIPGDLDGDGQLSNNDVVWLLWYSLFPPEITGDVQLDFNADGVLTNADVVTLMWHILFPEEFPL